MGGKSGKVAAQKPQDFLTNTGIGIGETPGKTLDTSTLKADSIDKKKMGTRGLQIPLVADTSTTETTSSAPGTGVQI